MILRLLLFAARCLSWAMLFGFLWLAWNAVTSWAGAFFALAQ